MSLVYQLYRFLFRGGYAADLEALNEVPLRQEGVYAPDARNLKVGDGSTHFNSLPWLLTPWAAGSGTNTITATYTAKPVLYDGMPLRVRAAGANTGAVTFNPNSLGAVAVKKWGGVALEAGDIPGAGHEMLLVYRSSVPCFELLNPKRQYILSAAKLLGRNDTTGGDAESITLGSGLSMSGTTLTASSGSGAFTYLGNVAVAGAAATSLTFSGLDLDTDLNYLIKIKGKNATASAGNIFPYINADTTATNYDSQTLTAAGATVSGGRANNARMADLIASSYFMGTAILTKDLQNKPTLIYSGMDGITTALRLVQSTVAWRTAGTNLTGLTFTSSVANSLDIGTRVDIWKFS